MADPRSKAAPDGYTPHLGESRQYMRDIILGVNDGLVSTFLLVAGVVGGGLTATQVLLTGIAGAVAGMVSMGAGEYLATKSQEEVFDAEMKLEARHLNEHRDHERDELRHMFGAMGLRGDDLETVVEIIDNNDDSCEGLARFDGRNLMQYRGGSELTIGQVEQFHGHLDTAYEMAGYELIEVPKGSIDERADYLLRSLRPS